MLELWRATKATLGMLENRPAAETLELMRPVLERNALAAEEGSSSSVSPRCT